MVLGIDSDAPNVAKNLRVLLENEGIHESTIDVDYRVSEDDMKSHKKDDDLFGVFNLY